MHYLTFVTMHTDKPTLNNSLICNVLAGGRKMLSNWRVSSGLHASTSQLPTPSCLPPPRSPRRESPHVRAVKTRRNPIIWASLFSRNLLPGVVNIHRSTQELLCRILEGQPVPDLDRGAIPVLVSAFDATR